MVRIGVVNIDTSHPKAFAEIFAQNGKAVYAGIYNDSFRGDDEVQGFMRTAGIKKRYTSVADMAQDVDVGFVQGCDWDTHLAYAQPFIDAGKPVFIDKPIVGNVRDVHKLRALAQQGAVILGSSCMRYAPQITQFLALPEEERGAIVSLHSTCGVDEFNYAIHAVEAIGGLVGTGAVSCTYVGGGQVGSIQGETYAVQYDNGIVATYAMTYGQWQKSVVSVLTTKRTYVLEPAGYDAMLDLVIDSVATGQRLTASVEALAESILIMLAGRISRAQGGTKVNLKDIPMDDPGFDGAVFKAGYVAAAKPMYV